MLAVVVTFQIKPERIEDFMPLMRDNANASLNREAGCHQFDICTDRQRPNEVFLYELYSDSAAFDAHLQSPHYHEFDAGTADMIEEKRVLTYEKVE